MQHDALNQPRTNLAPIPFEADAPHLKIVGELPLIGVLLGNGRDRGLLGITFKLNGPFNQPKLTINPLSIIAPGVFRSIFEFQ